MVSVRIENADGEVRETRLISREPEDDLPGMEIYFSIFQPFLQPHQHLYSVMIYHINSV